MAIINQNRGVSPPHGDALFTAEKCAKRLLLAEGMVDSFVRRRYQAVTVPALPTFCGAHPLGAPRLLYAIRQLFGAPIFSIRNLLALANSPCRRRRSRMDE